MKRLTITLFLFIIALLAVRELPAGYSVINTPGVAEAQSATEPELPRVLLDTTYPASPGSTINVAAGGNLQAALNSALPGDTIVLQAGAQYVGNFTLPAKTGSGWVVVRTSNMAGIPTEGTRATPSNAAAMPKILTPNSGPALATSPSAHHYRFVGLEVGISAGVMLNYGIVTLGDSSSAQSSLSVVPSNLVIDRCYIHGNATGDVSRGVALNSASSAVIDSTISACHGVGFDTQAICGWNGPGPFKITNNFLEGAGENVMFGGADPKIANLVPSDIEFRRNVCSKPMSWCATEASYAGIHWGIKNLFELKNAQRTLVDGNIFEFCWVDAQVGFAIQLTPRNQDGTAPWSVVQDVTFTNNIVRHSAAGINVLGHDDVQPAQQARRIKIKNNLLTDIGGPRWGGNGRLFQLLSGTANVRIDHNTAFQTYNIMTADGPPNTGFIYTNNIAPHNDYGFIGSGYGYGNPTLINCFPACVFAKNVLVGGPASVYPFGNFFPAAMSGVGFVDYAGGNYRLAATSPYKNAGTDGFDLGADIDAIEVALGLQPPSNQPPVVSVSATPTQGSAPLATNFSASASDPDGTVAAYSWNFGDGQTSTQPSPSHTYQTPGTFNARLTVTDNGGATASASVMVEASGSNSSPTVVLYASQAGVKVGNWQVVADAGAAGGNRMFNPDAGLAKVITAAANPSSYFEMTFTAQAGIPYHLWVRGKAQNNSPYNDSAHVQFSDSVSAAGAPVYRIGTTSSAEMNLEDCSGCGLAGWGWQDNGWGIGVMGPNIYFQASGQHTIRVQVREDGLSIDQIVLSPSTYLNSSPGTLMNDTTIVPPINQPPQVSITPSTTSGQAPLVVNFTAAATDADGTIVSYSWNFGNGQTSSAQSPSCTYQSSGDFTATLTVTDNGGATASASVVVRVASDSRPFVQIIRPNDPESLMVGSSYTITWSVTGANISSQTVQLSLDGGMTWKDLRTNLPGGSTAFNWTVPNEPTKTGRIRVMAYSGGAYGEGMSASNFTIAKKKRTSNKH
ncbi:MAG TPA: PKD domain-containing protein [Blastocatellia bacterium]|nr:PKD domain-containing protein [Blastocatellia bacterium]